MSDIMDNKRSVCVFCKNSILRDENYKDCPGSYMCRIHPNKRVVDPVMGTPTYLIIERNKRFNGYGEIEGYDPELPFEYCIHYNLDSKCPDFDKIGMEEEELLFPSEIGDEEVKKLFFGKAEKIIH